MASMANFLSPSPWSWILEILADLKEVDTALLKALISRVPDFSEHSHEITKQRISLRYLEEFLDSPCSSIIDRVIDHSEFSEDVLYNLFTQAILNDKFQTEKNAKHDNLRQFIASKRSSFPPYAIEHFTDPTYSSLVEESQLSCGEDAQQNRARNLNDSKIGTALDTLDCESPSKLLCHGPQMDRQYFARDEVVNASKHGFISTNVASHAGSPDWTERRICIKCTLDGHLLTCNEPNCPLSFHESCLGSPPFDKAGRFYCPFCSYTRATTACREAEEKVSQAWKALSFSLAKVIRNCSYLEEYSETH